jgi:large subunit ribosomal protein L7/L12
MSEAVANTKLSQIIDTVKTLTVLELADLVHALEKEFGVSAAAVAVAGPAGGGNAAAAAVEAPTVFKVTLVEVPPEKKIQAIKIIREILGLGLADAKGFVEGAPKLVKDGLEKAAADELAKKITDAGAKAKIEGA